MHGRPVGELEGDEHSTLQNSIQQLGATLFSEQFSRCPFELQAEHAAQRRERPTQTDVLSSLLLSSKFDLHSTLSL